MLLSVAWWQSNILFLVVVLNIILLNSTKVKYKKQKEKKMDRFYTCEEVAEKYRVKIETVWSWIRAKKLSAVRIGKQYRVTENDLARFEQGSQSAEA